MAEGRMSVSDAALRTVVERVVAAFGMTWDERWWRAELARSGGSRPVAVEQEGNR